MDRASRISDALFRSVGTPPRAVRQRRDPETELQKAVEEWEARLLDVFPCGDSSAHCPDQMVAYQCNDGFRLPAGIKEAVSTVVLLDEPYFSFNREYGTYGNFCFALSIGGMREAGVRACSHGDQHWDAEHLSLFGRGLLEQLYLEGVRGAKAGLLRPADWPRLVDPDDLEPRLKAVYSKALEVSTVPENVDAAFLRAALLDALGAKQSSGSAPKVFAYMPTHCDTFYTTFGEDYLRKLATDHSWTGSRLAEYDPSVDDGGAMWLDTLEQHEEVTRVGLTPIWETALGGKRARLFTAGDERAIRSIMDEIEVSTLKQLEDSDTAGDRENFMKFSLPWWTTKRLPVNYQEFTSHEMMDDLDVFKKCCIAFSFLGKLVYRLDARVKPGTPAALEFWNDARVEWSEDVKYALERPAVE